MYHFFVEASQIGEDTITIIGEDVNHIKNVLRMKCGEEVEISDGQGGEYICKISSLKEEVVLTIVDYNKKGTELESKLYLFQGLPKNDKMELIIQKAVELGATAIVPVNTKRTVVKLDEKKEANKLKRWQTISESAAKQSKRGIIPEVLPVMNFKEAVEYAKNFDINIIPYEHCEDMSGTKKIVDSIKKDMKIGIFIGPEGGFAEIEIDFAMENNISPVSLGKRILRTETAGLAILSILMFKLED